MPAQAGLGLSRDASETKGWQVTPGSATLKTETNQSPSPTMKIILIAASLALLTTSCRTFVPVDPMSGVPGCRMMPEKTSSCSCKPCECTCKDKGKGVVQASK